MIELTPQELATVEAQLAARPGRRVQTDTPQLTVKRIIVVSSGKGGVGKSTITANLATLAAQRGFKVGILDADLHGFSITRLMGVTDRATRVEPIESTNPKANGQAEPNPVGRVAAEPRVETRGRALIKAPEAHGVKVISIGMFTDPAKAVIWRGPMAHRALSQFLTNADWGELDLLLIDLPPGTGDIALSIANLLPDAQLLIVTTPQAASAEVAARAGTMSEHTHQKVIGVVENMAWLPGPAGEKVELFGQGGGTQVAEQLTATLGYPVPLLGQIPLDPNLPRNADAGQPIAIVDPASPATAALQHLADAVLR